MGLWNLSVMVPFCRTPEEGKKVVATMAKYGLDNRISKQQRLAKQPGDLVEQMEVWVMAEIPSNILQVEDFAEIFDGFSIGSNDLTQLTLGLDRDSGLELLAADFDERDPAIKFLLKQAINACLKKGKYVGICGQGPSDHPDFAQWLVDANISSISLNPDSVVSTWQDIAKHQAT